MIFFSLFFLFTEEYICTPEFRMFLNQMSIMEINLLLRYLLLPLDEEPDDERPDDDDPEDDPDDEPDEYEPPLLYEDLLPPELYDDPDEYELPELLLVGTE
jgi:hypothetical protein